MKNINIFAASLFVAALLAGGAAVQAQTTDDVECSMSAASVAVGQSITLTATGGDGDFVWSSPGLVITDPTGPSFTVTFNAAGTFPVTVTSDGDSDVCNVVVTAIESPAPGTPAPTTPGLPNTGELPV